MSRADFTITVRDTDAGCWITMRGNQTGATIQRCVQGPLVLVLFAIGRMWIKSAAKMHPERAPVPAFDCSRSTPKTNLAATTNPAAAAPPLKGPQ